MNNTSHRAGWIRRILAIALDIGTGAGMGFILMWPLGTFESHEAYTAGQATLRIIGLIVAGFVVLNAWSLWRKRPSLGRRIMGFGTAENGADKPVRWWAIVLRIVATIILSALPFVLLVVSLMWERWTG